MSEGVLSQEEIDALLQSDSFASDVPASDSGQAAGGNQTGSTGTAGFDLGPIETDALGEVANIVMGSAATALSTLLGRRVEITTPIVQLTDPETFRQDYPLPYLLVNVEYVQGLSGSNVLVIKDGDAGVMADLLMGGDGQTPPAGLEGIHLSAISEAMNQMMGAASAAMATMINEQVDISPPSVEMIDLATDELKGSVGQKDRPLVKISLKIIIDGLVDSELMQLIPFDLAKGMVKNLMNEMSGENPADDTSDLGIPDLADLLSESQPAVEPPTPAAAAPGNTYQAEPPQPIYTAPVQMQTAPDHPAAAPSAIPVQPVQFAPLQPAYQPKEMTNIDLIMDVPLQITVELGKSRKTIREILNLGPGSVVELDKLAGEPVDLLVNGKLLAKGEVVVIDENFGIRITDIISPIERVSSLQ